MRYGHRSALNMSGTKAVRMEPPTPAKLKLKSSGKAINRVVGLSM
jgi:hypothetical protein